jgi:hypothetical protein
MFSIFLFFITVLAHGVCFFLSQARRSILCFIFFFVLFVGQFGAGLYFYLFYVGLIK